MTSAPYSTPGSIKASAMPLRSVGENVPEVTWPSSCPSPSFSLMPGRGIPRPGMRLNDGEGHELGQVTSGTFSPTLRKGIALALIEPGVEYGAEVIVDVRGRAEPFTVVKPPFVEPSTRGS